MPRLCRRVVLAGSTLLLVLAGSTRAQQPAVAPAAVAPTAAPRPEPKQVTLVTLLFDQLGNEARTIARKAALDFLAADHRALLWISVFAVDRRMRLLQQFTMDRDEVRAAVEVATGAAHSGRTDLAAESSRVGREAPPRPPGSTPPPRPGRRAGPPRARRARPPAPPRGMPPSPGSSRMRST